MERGRIFTTNWNKPFPRRYKLILPWYNIHKEGFPGHQQPSIRRTTTTTNSRQTHLLIKNDNVMDGTYTALQRQRLDQTTAGQEQVNGCSSMLYRFIGTYLLMVIVNLTGQGLWLPHLLYPLRPSCLFSCA